MLVVDTSALLALASRRDTNHRAAVRAVEADPGLVVPAGILAEAAFMIERRAGTPALLAFVSDLASGALAYDPCENDFERIGALVERYEDLPLSFADAAVIACAERGARRVLSFDRRDFTVVAREGTFELVPDRPG